MSEKKKIENGIDAERRRIQRENRQKAIVVFAGLALCALTVYVVERLDFSDFTTDQGTTQSTPAASPREEPVMGTVDGGAQSLENEEQKRAHFKEVLKSFEAELEPRLQEANLNDWAPEEKFRIEDSKSRALNAYANSDYDNALKQIEDATQVAQDVLAKQKTMFSEAMGKALAAHDHDDYRNALLNIEMALKVAPLDLDAQTLKDKIDILPEILAQIDAAKIARAENDLAKELGILREIEKLAPQRIEVTERATILEREIRENLFSNAIAQGIEAAEKGDISVARSALKQAQNIFPNRDETAFLSSHVATLEKKIRIANLISESHEAMAADDWDRVREKLSKAQAEAPNNRDILEELEKANTILDLKAQISAFEQNPLRLSNMSTRTAADKTVVAAGALNRESPSLADAVDRLSNLLTLVNRPVPVQVVSDNKTFVQVRAVGKVGLVREKTIELKPGIYTFEGLRTGFKSKLMKVEIPFDGPAPTIEVICDEPA